MSFPIPRPRGADAPAKLPVQRKKAAPITTKGTTRVMNARGVWQAKLNPNAASIVIEGAEQGRARSDKRRAIVRGLS